MGVDAEVEGDQGLEQCAEQRAGAGGWRGRRDARQQRCLGGAQQACGERGVGEVMLGGLREPGEEIACW
ncbi:MAG: hypothetical protein ACRDRW_05690 [Pseudonocardiaceae bacterium]